MTIREIKQLLGLSYAEMSKQTNLDFTYLMNHRNDDIKSIKLENAAKIAKYMNVSLEKLMSISMSEIESALDDVRSLAYFNK